VIWAISISPSVDRWRPSATNFHASRELLEVEPLRGPQRMLTEERNDRAEELVTPTDVVLSKVLLVVIVAHVRVDASDPEEVPKVF